MVIYHSYVSLPEGTWDFPLPCLIPPGKKKSYSHGQIALFPTLSEHQRTKPLTCPAGVVPTRFPFIKSET